MNYLLLFLFISNREPELDLADTLLERGLYPQALREYQRFIFYQFSSPSLPYAQYKLALSYLQRGKEGDWLKGEQLLREIIFSPALEDTLVKKEARTSLLRYYINSRRFRSVEDLLIKTNETFFLRRIKEVRLPKKVYLSSLSYLIPGSGEIYAGRYKEGISAFLFTTLSGYGVYFSLKRGKKMDALLLFSFLFLRFYGGSIKNARLFLQEYNERYLEERLRELILKEVSPQK